MITMQVRYKYSFNFIFFDSKTIKSKEGTFSAVYEIGVVIDSEQLARRMSI